MYLCIYVSMYGDRREGVCSLSLYNVLDYLIPGMCFSLLLPYYKNPFLDLGKNIVKWLGQCFLPELAN